MLVLAMEFSKGVRARRRRSLRAEQEQLDSPRRARHEGIPKAEAMGVQPTPRLRGMPNSE